MVAGNAAVISVVNLLPETINIKDDRNVSPLMQNGAWR
jgi:hypothetical protein